MDVIAPAADLTSFLEILPPEMLRSSNGFRPPA